jgi:DNA polymerase III subunit alpha
MFIHLRARSYYSFLDGLCSPAQLAQAAAQFGMPAIGLADRSGMTGAVEFYEACQAFNVRPILGLELPVNLAGDIHIPTRVSPHNSLVLIAMDMQGWASLCRLSSQLLAKSPHDAGEALGLEQVAENSRGLLCLTGGVRGPFTQLLLENRKVEAYKLATHLKDAFPDRLYFEIQMHTPQDAVWVSELARLARRSGVALVATHAVHYLKAEQAHLQRLVTAIRHNHLLESLESEASALPDAYFLSEADMHRRFASLPSDLAARALHATVEVADRCRLELPLDVHHYPITGDSAGKSPIQLLTEKSLAGARRMYGDAEGKLDASVGARLKHELSVIDSQGYASLFLIMEEILGFARGAGVPFSSRGSAASSLVAHCLGITTPDPLRLKLYFERFLNPARATPPDIDTDLCSRRRQEVINFVYRRFGAQRVATVCTITRYRRRSALRETAKAYGLPSTQVKKLADSLPPRNGGHPALSNGPAFAELSEQYPSPLYEAIFKDADALLGIPRHLSVHPGGLVISSGPLTDLAPTMLAPKGVVITQFDLDSVERLGMVKIDLLGIRGLTVLGDVAQAIFNHTGPTQEGIKEGNPRWPGLARFSGAASPVEVLEAVPDEDSGVSDLVETAATIGCFQIESPGMRATLKEIHARSIDDIMAALALFRPGPLSGGLKDAFVRRHRGLEPVEQLHPSLNPLLDDTYGVILYQEQVLLIAHELAGLSLADADLLRRAMSHFDPGKQMQSLKERFMAGAMEKKGVPESVSERVWELMAAFAGYGFPKAHAASYAQIAWRAAWCKAYFPAEFISAVLANWGGYYGQRVYLNEARRLKLAIRPPHINFSRPEFSLHYSQQEPILFMGLDQVRDLTRRTMGRILRGRPFVSLTDFLARADPRPIEAENLVRVGALSGLGSIPFLLEQLRGGGWRGGQLSLFTLQHNAETTGDDWSLAEKMAAQDTILGVSVEAHPLELYASDIAATGAMTTIEAATRVGQKVRVAGMRQIWRRVSSPKGDTFYYLSLEDLEGMLDTVIYSDVYRRHRSELSGHGPYILEGRVERNTSSGEPTLKVERLWRLR